MESKSQLRNCSFIKFILMILVILGHASAFWSGHWFKALEVEDNSESLNVFYEWVNSFHIYAFTLVSGYIFAYKNHQGDYKSFSHFIINKAKRLLIPYLFSVVFWVAPISNIFYSWNILEIIKKYIFCINPSQLWFLWMLFGVFVIMRLLWRFYVTKPVWGWVFVIFFYFLGIFFNSRIPNVFCVWSTCQYMLFFYIGIRLYLKNANKKEQFIHWYLWIILDVFLFVIYMITSRFSNIIWDVFNYLLLFIIHLVGSMMAWCVIQWIGFTVKWEDSKLFKVLSKYAMPIYLFHQQFIYISLYFLNGKMSPWYIFIINFVVAIIGSFIISHLLMKCKITRFLIGER